MSEEKGDSKMASAGGVAITIIDEPNDLDVRLGRGLVKKQNQNQGHRLFQGTSLVIINCSLLNDYAGGCIRHCNMETFLYFGWVGVWTIVQSKNHPRLFFTISFDFPYIVQILLISTI